MDKHAKRLELLCNESMQSNIWKFNEHNFDPLWHESQWSCDLVMWPRTWTYELAGRPICCSCPWCRTSGMAVAPRASSTATRQCSHRCSEKGNCYTNAIIKSNPKLDFMVTQCISFLSGIWREELCPPPPKKKKNEFRQMLVNFGLYSFD